MVTAKPKAYSYLHLSTPEQQKGDSLRRQTQLAEDYCRTHGLQLDTELSLRDLGVSAFRGDNVTQGALGAFRNAVQQGMVPEGSFLLVESLDRLSRKAAYRAQSILTELVEQGVTVVTLSDGKKYDSATLESDPFALLYALMIFIRAHEESAMKSRRLKAAWHGKRLKIGERALTKMTPKWIELDTNRKPVLVEARAKIVRRIVKDYMRGVGKPAIAKALNTEGAPPIGRAKFWHWSYITKILASPALVGTFVPHIHEYKDGVRSRIPQDPVPNYYPAVIDSETYERLQSLLGRGPLRGRHTRAPMSNILSGLTRCPVCASSMPRVSKSSKKKQSKPTLVCSKARAGAGCTYRMVSYDDVEGALVEGYERIIREMPHPDAQLERNLKAAQATVDDLEGRMADLMRLLERRPSDTLARRVAQLEVDLKEAHQERDDAAAVATQAERKVVAMKADALGVAMRAKPFSRERINAALRELLDGVTVDYTTGHLRFHWRAGGESDVLFMWPEEGRKSRAKHLAAQSPHGKQP